MEEMRDREVDRVMHALRQAEPGAEMHGRILAALHRAGSPISPAKALHREWPLWAIRLQAASWPVAAALLLAAGCGSLLMWRVHHGTYSPHTFRASDMGAVGPAADLPDALRVTRTGPHMSHSQEVHATGRQLSDASRNSGLRPLMAFQSHVSDARHEGSIHVADDRSFPAPPLPLTQQERLLLRLVKHEPAMQLAQLSKLARDAVFQREKDEVDAFFAPPPSASDVTTP